MKAILLVSAALWIGSCSGDSARQDAGPLDGADAGQDAGRDAGQDAGQDAGSPDGADAGLDAGQDAGPLDGADAGRDAGGDVGCQVIIDHTPVESAEIGDIPVEADVPGATEVALHYRRQGQSAYTSLPMTASGDLWTGVIPAADVTFAPMQYYLEATDGSCTVRDPDTDFHDIRIWGTKRITEEADVYEYLPSVYGTLVAFAREEAAGTQDDVWLFDLHSFEFIQVTDLDKPQGAADIFGDNVVWVDGRNDDDGPNPDIYLRDLETDQEHQVTTDPLGQYGVVLFDRIVAWRDDRHMTGPIDGDIYLYDLGSDRRFGTADDAGEIRLTPHPADQTAPGVHVDDTGRVRIVWYDFRDDQDGVCDAACDWNVYLYDFGPDGLHGTADDSGPHQVTSDPLEQTSPVIFGHRIAWRDARDGDWLHPDIYYYDLGADGAFGTADDSGVQKLPVEVVEADSLDMWDNLLVYDDYRDGSYEIYLYDFETGVETPVTSAPRGQFYPRIHDRTIVWQDARHNDPEGEPFDDLYVHVLP